MKIPDNWTHTGVKITDIRKMNKLYSFTILDEPQILFIQHQIFEDRLNSYFFTKTPERKDILDLTWNLYITKGFYVKKDSNGVLTPFTSNEKNKLFVSYLEISGPLSSFNFIKPEDTLF